MLSILVQDVHQVGDVAGGQPQRLDLGQLGVGRYVGYTLPQLRKGRVNALGPPPLLTVGRGSPLHSPRMCVMVVVHTDRSVHRDCPSSRNQAAGSVMVVMVMVRVRTASSPAAAVAMVLWAVAGREAILGGRHIRVTYQPARKVRRSSSVLVTPTGRRRMQGIVVAFVVVHDRVVREARDKTHSDTHKHALTRAHTFSCTHSHTHIHT